MLSNTLFACFLFCFLREYLHVLRVAIRSVAAKQNTKDGNNEYGDGVLNDSVLNLSSWRLSRIDDQSQVFTSEHESLRPV